MIFQITSGLMIIYLAWRASQACRDFLDDRVTVSKQWRNGWFRRDVRIIFDHETLSRADIPVRRFWIFTLEKAIAIIALMMFFGWVILHP